MKYVWCAFCRAIHDALGITLFLTSYLKMTANFFPGIFTAPTISRGILDWFNIAAITCKMFSN
jgi:hypothetical protein